MAKRNLSKNLEKPPARIGRPPEEVPQDKAASLLAWMSEGKSVLAWCSLPGNPTRGTIDNWRTKDKAFSEAFAHAREASADVLVERAQEVADDSSEDTLTTDSGEKANSEWIQRSKLRVDVLMRRAACYDPKRYGTNRAQVEHTGKLSLESLVAGSFGDANGDQAE